jgi:hypothetical protein
MENIQEILKISTTANVINGVLELDTVTGEQFEAISNIWSGNINCKRVTGDLNISTKDKNVKVNIKESYKSITGDIENVIFNIAKNIS